METAIESGGVVLERCVSSARASDGGIQTDNAMAARTPAMPARRPATVARLRYCQTMIARAASTTTASTEYSRNQPSAAGATSGWVRIYPKVVNLQIDNVLKSVKTESTK